MSAALEVDGLSDSRKALRRMDKDLRRGVRVMDKEIAEDEIVPKVKPHVPVLSGRTVKSLRGGADSKGGFVRAGRASMPGVPPVHWGWPARNIEGNRYMVKGLRQVDGGLAAQYMERLQLLISTAGLEVKDG